MPSKKISGVKPAYWWPRFWAWLIDVIIVGIVSWVFFRGIGAEPWNFGINGILFLIYWTILESDGRQSIGKKAMGLKLVRIDGKNADTLGTAVSAIGKAFLLPLDMIIGVLARPGKKQRLFNIASDTVVVRTK